MEKKRLILTTILILFICQISFSQRYQKTVPNNLKISFSINDNILTNKCKQVTVTKIGNKWLIQSQDKTNLESQYTYVEIDEDGYVEYRAEKEDEEDWRIEPTFKGETAYYDFIGPSDAEDLFWGILPDGKYDNTCKPTGEEGIICEKKYVVYFNPSNPRYTIALEPETQLTLKYLIYDDEHRTKEIYHMEVISWDTNITSFDMLLPK